MATIEASPPRRHVLRRNSDFRLLWVGQTVSEIGVNVTLVALPLLAVVNLHASTFSVGVLAGAEGVAWPLLALPLGVWVDRLRRRPLLLGSDVARGLALCTVPVAAAADRLTMAQLYVVAALTGALSIVFGLAYQAYLPTLVADDDLVAGNSALIGSQQVAAVGGPGLGGALVQLVGAATAVLADALSYLFSAACLALIRTPEEPPDRSTRRSLRAEIGEGWHHMWRHPVLRLLMATVTHFNLFLSGIQALSVVFLVRSLHASPAVVGLVLALGPVGGLAAVIAVGRLTRAVGTGRTLLAAGTLAPLAALAVPLATSGPGVLLLAVGLSGISGGIAIFNVVAGSYRQQVIPGRLLGRVVASTRAVTWASLPVGSLLGGVLGESLGLRSALWLLALGGATSPLWLWTSDLRAMRDLPLLPATPLPASGLAAE